MIDFEQEIETRLAHFQHLTGKGNVKDGNRTLYEILRLMLGMINQGNGETPPAPPPTPLVEPSEEEVRTTDVEPTYSIGQEVQVEDIVMITSETLAYPATEVQNPEIMPVVEPEVHAPYGFTKHGYIRQKPAMYGMTANGNVRRFRPNRQRGK